MRDPRQVCGAAGATRRWSGEKYWKTMNGLHIWILYYVV